MIVENIFYDPFYYFFIVSFICYLATNHKLIPLHFNDSNKFLVHFSLRLNDSYKHLSVKTLTVHSGTETILLPVLNTYVQAATYICLSSPYTKKDVSRCKLCFTYLHTKAPSVIQHCIHGYRIVSFLVYLDCV